MKFALLVSAAYYGIGCTAYLLPIRGTSTRVHFGGIPSFGHRNSLPSNPFFPVAATTSPEDGSPESSDALNMKDPDGIESLRAQAAALRADALELEKALELSRPKIALAPEPAAGESSQKNDQSTVTASVMEEDEKGSAMELARAAREELERREAKKAEEGFQVPSWLVPPKFGGDDNKTQKRSIVEGPEIEDIRDRVFACLPYLLPMLDGLQYGNGFFQMVPGAGATASVILGPFAEIRNAIPFGGLIFFLILSFLSRNENLNRGVRFSMQQAILIDIALILPSLVGGLASIGGEISPVITTPAENFVFYFLIATISYSVGSNLLGKVPNGIPIISEAAERSIGPF